MFSKLLKFSAPIFILVGILHLILGLGADILLGAKIPEQVRLDPVLDSQNRFYGVSFMLYGVLLYHCAKDIIKYKSIIYYILLIFFIAGLSRIVSIVLYGMPSNQVIILLLSELLIPPILINWLSKIKEL